MATTSLASRLIDLYLRLKRRKRVFADAGGLHRSIHEGRRAGAPRPPFWLRFPAGVVAHERQVAGRPLFELLPASGNTSGATLLFLHGGAYVHELFWPHWLFLARLVRRLRLRILVPIYPLAPEHDHSVTRDYLLTLWQKLVAAEDPTKLFVGGDSAGGGLSLALAQQIQIAGLPLPRGLVLISPWLDASLADPDIPALDPLDPVLGREGLLEAARLYAAGAPLEDPWLSPLHGPLAGLPPIRLFAGTRDLLLPDSRHLAHRAAAAGVDVLYHEAPGMIHDWMLLPLPESQKPLAILADLFGSPTGRHSL